MDAFNPSDFESEMYSIHVSQGRLPGKGYILSLVAAYAQHFAYSFEYLQAYVARLNARSSGFTENIAGQIEMPSKIEFLEALEFRETEIARCITDNSARWEWPRSWGSEWGSDVTSSIDAFVDSKDSCDKWIRTIIPDRLLVHLDQTKRAIAVQKALLGHHQPVPLDWYTRELLSRIIDIFAKTDLFGRFPPMIEIVWTYDLANSLRKVSGNDNCRRYAIDGILGDYYRPGGGRRHLIRVHKRAVDLCASELHLDPSHLINVVIVHELAHWLVHSYPHRGLAADWNNWPKSQDEMTNWYDSTGSDVHEAWAQLLTYIVCSGDEGITRTFEKLLPHQPSEYHQWKKVYNVSGNDSVRLMRSLIQMRQGKKSVIMDDWLDMIGPGPSACRVT